MDSSGNFAIGGTSSDDNIVDASGVPNPFVVFYQPDGTILWHEDLDTNYDSVQTIAFSNDDSKLAFTTARLSD